MGTRVLRTYRVDKALVDAVLAQARARGETATDVIERAFRAYIQHDSSAIAPAQAVYTPLPPPPQVVEEAIVPLEGKRPCRHPSGSVKEGVCQECGQDVWLR